MIEGTNDGPQKFRPRYNTGLHIHVFVEERHRHSCNIFQMSNFLRKMEDIQTILQRSECLSAAKICGQNMFLMCNFIFMQHNSHSDKVKSLNLKTCKSINLKPIHIYMDSL